ncbi:MAG: VWA domain-containing protein [Pseudomonadota bacterium]
MFTFYWPWLVLLLPIPLLIRWLLPEYRDHDESMPALRFPALARLQMAFSRGQISERHSNKLFLITLCCIWLSLVLAVMRPQLVDKFTDVKNKGYDLMLAVDISKSMQALDFSTQVQAVSRLDMTKKVVSKFVQKRQGDRIGLILFGENAYLQVPLTLDTAAVSQMLNNAVTGMAGPATAIGDAIGLAVRSLRERPDGSRVIILLTDGEDTASTIPPLQAAKLAQEYDIHIYTIGVGKNGPVPYPTGTGGIVMANIPIDEALLKQIAKTTGGAYFRATNANALQRIYDKINKLEKTDAEVREYLIRDPLYHYPLAVAALLLLFLCVVPAVRRVINAI